MSKGSPLYIIFFSFLFFIPFDCVLAWQSFFFFASSDHGKRLVIAMHLTASCSAAGCITVFILRDHGRVICFFANWIVRC